VEQARRERLSRPNRQRAIGGGGQYALSLPDRLLLSLCSHRLYVTQALLGYLFDLDESNICRNLKELRPLLRDVLPTPERVLTRILETAKRIGTPEELFEKFPELQTVVDATDRIKVEHAISRIKKYRIASERYRGKEDAYDDHMEIVAGLVNQRRLDRLGLTI
jgi:hypothetical protein